MPSPKTELTLSYNAVLLKAFQTSPLIAPESFSRTVKPAVRQTRNSCASASLINDPSVRNGMRRTPPCAAVTALKAKGLQSASTGAPHAIDRCQSARTTRSKVRARVEHVIGQQQSSMGGKTVPTIGIVRASVLR